LPGHTGHLPDIVSRALNRACDCNWRSLHCVRRSTTGCVRRCCVSRCPPVASESSSSCSSTATRSTANRWRSAVRVASTASTHPTDAAEVAGRPASAPRPDSPRSVW